MAFTVNEGEKNYVRMTGAAITASGLNASESFPIGPFIHLSAQAVWASITGTAIFELQSTCDGTNWDTIPGTSASTSGAAGSTTIRVADCPGNYVRVKITSAAGAGTITPTFVAKR